MRTTELFMSIFPLNQPGISRFVVLGLLRRVWDHFSRRRKWQFALLFGLTLASACAEIISLGAVLPFLHMLIAPDQALRYRVVASAARSLGMTSAADLALFVTIVFVVAALGAGGMRLLYLWTSTQLSYGCGADLSIAVYRRTLYQPYQVHVARNSSEVMSGLMFKVNATAGALQSVMTLISSVILLVAVMTALLAINAALALVAAVGFGASYGVITWLFRKRVEHNSQLISRESTQVIKALQEGMGAIRDVLLDSTQSLYCEIYRRADYPIRQAAGNNAVIAGSPRYMMEALGMTLIAALAYSLTGESGKIVSGLPALGALALGAQRVLPAMQQTYVAWVNIAGCKSFMADTLELLDQPLPADARQPAPAPMPFRESIRFDGVRFRYSGDGPWVLNGINLSIPKGARVGIVGSTGSGKSTLLDLLMGLMDPTQGQILVDGLPVGGACRRAWQRNIAHVPQSIYLADTSFAENIAFGVAREKIDMEKVRQAAEQARIADFIESGPDGYHAVVGERGIRISGGERQRIGIARALYKQATVLVFDEATSALDNATERKVMDAIEGLNRDLTVAIVAHRITTVIHCDTIFEMAQGRIVAQGTYDYLLENSPSFLSMTKRR